MAHWYVATNGWNNNDGKSWSRPWITIQHAVSRLAPGDYLHIGPGNFRGATISAAAGCVSRTLAAPIRIVGEPGAVINNRSLLQLSAQRKIFPIISIAHWHFENLILDGSFHNSAEGVVASGSDQSGIQLVGCTTRNFANTSIVVVEMQERCAVV